MTDSRQAAAPQTRSSAGGVEVRGPMRPGYDRILTPEALAFVADLERRFGWRRRQLLERRAERQAELDGGARPDFLSHTRSIRDTDWTVAPVPRDLRKRVVESEPVRSRHRRAQPLPCPHRDPP